MRSPVFLNHLGIVCALGSGKREVRTALFGGAPAGVAPSDDFADRRLHVGHVVSPLADAGALPAPLRSRNNGLLLTALAELRPAVDAAIARYGRARVGIVLGTSTSGIGESEGAIAQHLSTGRLPASFHLQQQELGSPAMALSGLLGLAGPAQVISTACSSSAKALASAARLLRAGACDAVITGGADALCRFTVAGFSALESVSDARCNPMSVNRRGINIGEGAALFLMTREEGPVRLAGWGESSDAHHISAPEPGGRGALAAIEAALARAGVRPPEIDYVNLHGTATPQNDAMESRAVHALFGGGVPCSSTKPLTGHTLGAAGALEAAFCWLTLTDNAEGQLPPHWWDGAADPELPSLALVAPGAALGRPVRYALSNSFAFGGSNAALVLGEGLMRTPIGNWELSELVAHRGRMSLLDRALEADETGLVAEVLIREDSLFSGEGAGASAGVGGWVGIEFMAQAVGAWAGWHARQRGETPKIGFLLGTRRYACSRPVFRVGERLRIEIRQQFWADNGLGQFDCTISIGGENVASAALTVYEPSDPEGSAKVDGDE